jgi:uncharacterized repeat protein (TIGR01451 family)
MIGVTVFLACATIFARYDARGASQGIAQSSTFVVTADAYVASGRPNESRGGNPGLLIGRRNNPESGIAHLQRMRMLLRFDLNALSNVSVTDARLRLYATDAESQSGGNMINIEMYRVSAPWMEQSVTWNNQPTIEPSPLSEIDLDNPRNAWITWPIPASVVQQWIDAPAQNHGLMFSSPSAEESGDQVRNYYAREFDFGRFAPYLEISFVEITPTPTFTPTPTPGTKTISLQNNPTGALLPGSALTYTVIVSNGPYPLSNIVVTNSAPGELVILPDTIDDGAMGWQHQTAGQAITWTLNQFSPNTLAQLHYQAALPTPTPTATPTTLAITKTGPQFVAPGELITYTLYVDNQSPYTLTEVAITDTLPAVLTLVDPGGALTTTLPAQLVWQEAAPLVSGATLTRNFSGRPVAAVTEVVNADYQVQATIVHSDTQEAISALGALSVTTIVTTTPPDLRVPVIVNTGACVRWQYAVPGEPFQTGIQCSGPTFNPLQAQWLPFVSR